MQKIRLVQPAAQRLRTLVNPRRSPLACVWIETGNPHQPLACVWIDPEVRIAGEIEATATEDVLADRPSRPGLHLVCA
jgi:hypothetical protein